MIKNLRFIILNIKVQATKHKSLFIIFLATQMIMSICLIYVIAKTDEGALVNSSYDYELKTFVVWGTDIYKLNAENLVNSLKWFDENSDISQIIIALEPPPEIDKSYTSFYAFPFSEQELFMSIPEKYKVKNAMKLSINDIENKNIVIYADNLVNNEIGDSETLTLYGKSYFMAGLVDMFEMDYTLISYNSVLKNKLPVEKILITYNEIQDEADMTNKSFDIYSAFPGANIELPAERDFDLEERLNNNKVLSYSMLLLAVISLVYIYAYFLNKRKKNMLIFIMCGCTRLRLLASLIFEVCILFLIQFSLAIICLKAFLNRFIIFIEPAMRMTLNSDSYLKALIFSAIVIILVFIPEVLFFQTKNLKK